MIGRSTRGNVKPSKDFGTRGVVLVPVPEQVLVPVSVWMLVERNTPLLNGSERSEDWYGLGKPSGQKAGNYKRYVGSSLLSHPRPGALSYCRIATVVVVVAVVVRALNPLSGTST